MKNNKKFIIIVSVIVGVMVLVFGALFYISLQTAPGGAPAATAPGLTNFGQRPPAPGSVTVTTPSTAPEETPAGVGEAAATIINKLNQVSLLPVVGAYAVDSASSTLRYVSLTNGNVYENSADNPGDNKITGTSLFGVHDATFASGGASVIMRYLKDDGATIESFLGAIIASADGSPADLKGSFLPENITSLSASPDGKNIFYLFKAGDGVAGINSSVDGSKKSQIFSSAFSEWTADWPNASLITLATKPSYGVEGYLYSLNPTSGAFDKILSGIKGLTAKVSPDGKSALYADNGLNLKLYSITGRTSADLGLRGLPEKCVWSADSSAIYCAVPKDAPADNYPDAWYQGLVSFEDSVWKIDIKTNAFSLLADPANQGATIDGINLFLNKQGNKLYFKNKIDSTLWSLDLS